ncbi:MAG: hypothetical protein ACT4OM_06030 [Actinomycetota bacterium]
MAIDREMIRQVRSLDRYDLRRLMILVEGMLVQHGESSRSSDPAQPVKVTYRLEPVRCGKAGCSRCPHGPYWYAYWREGDKVRSRYIGRKLSEAEIELRDKQA